MTRQPTRVLGVVLGIGCLSLRLEVSLGIGQIIHIIITTFFTSLTLLGFLEIPLLDFFQGFLNIPSIVFQKLLILESAALYGYWYKYTVHVLTFPFAK